ncbi:MAG: Maf family protein [Bacillota bacterium]
MSVPNLILASSSPRRKELLSQLNIDFTVVPGKINEEEYEDRNPEKMVKETARAKAEETARLVENTVIIAADTVVYYDNEILGKPGNSGEAERVLQKLSGDTHKVFTGLAVFSTIEKRIILDYDVTKVYMRDLKKEEIINYVKSGEPLDKAGSYGIQGIGGILVEKIVGSFYTVVGLPIHKLAVILDEFSINII